MKKLLLVLCAGLLAFLFGEGGARLFFRHKNFLRWQAATLRYQADACFSWKLVPGEYRRSLEMVRINSLGLRGPEITHEKEPGEFRIFVLGGSAAFNVNSEGGRTWPRILERKLQAQFGPKIRVVNGSTPGYTSYQSARRLKCQLLSLSPDLVLVYHLWNDVKFFSESNQEALISYLDAHGRFNEGSTMNFLTGRIPLFDELTRWSQLVTRLRFAMIKLVRHFRKVSDEGREKGNLDLQIHENGVGFYRNNLLKIRSLLAKQKIPLLIAKQPLLIRPDNTSEERRRIRYGYSGFRHEILMRAIQLGWDVNDEVCRLRGVHCVPAHQKVPSTLEYFHDHVHPTPKGRQAIADAVFLRVARIIANMWSSKSVFSPTRR